MGAWCAWKPGSKPHVPCPNLHIADFAVQSKSLQLRIRLLVTVTSYTKTTLHVVMTWAPVAIICFEIYNFIMVVSAIHNDEWHEAVFIDTI